MTRPRPKRRTDRRLWCRRCNREITARSAVAWHGRRLVHGSCSDAAIIAAVRAASAGQQ